MKRIFYFLLGFTLSVAWGIQYVHAEDCVSESAVTAYIDNLYPDCAITYVGHFSSYNDALTAACAADIWSQCNNYNNSALNDGLGTYVLYRWGYTPPQNTVYYASYNTSVFSLCALDSDNDGISDEYDLKPDSSTSYKAAIVSVCYDANNKVVAGVIQDGEGNQYSFGTMPTDFEGYTIESVSGDLITYQTAEDLATSLEKLNIDDLNITNQSKPIEIQDDGSIIPGSTDPFSDYRDAEDEQTKAEEPDTVQAPSEQPDSNDADSDRFDKIIKNTASTNTNLDNIQKYLGITNDSLAKINENIKGIDSGAAVLAPATGTTPTADEIGQAVKDNLIDSGQTIDTTITDNIPDLDETDTLTATQTKYSDRYDLFITTLKESDLFSLPFGIFTGPSGSGVSIQTVNIGKWGSSNERTATIDYSDYDNIWNILRSVLLLLTSFSCFKILVLKKG